MAFKDWRDQARHVILSPGDMIIDVISNQYGLLIERERRISYVDDDVYFWKQSPERPLGRKQMDMVLSLQMRNYVSFNLAEYWGLAVFILNAKNIFWRQSLERPPGQKKNWRWSCPY